MVEEALEGILEVCKGGGVNFVLDWCARDEEEDSRVEGDIGLGKYY